MPCVMLSKVAACDAGIVSASAFSSTMFFFNQPSEGTDALGNQPSVGTDALGRCIPHAGCGIEVNSF